MENSGRSRVAESELSGMANNGLPARSVALGPGTKPAPDGAASATPFPSALGDGAST